MSSQMCFKFSSYLFLYLRLFDIPILPELCQKYFDVLFRLVLGDRLEKHEISVTLYTAQSFFFFEKHVNIRLSSFISKTFSRTGGCR